MFTSPCSLLVKRCLLQPRHEHRGIFLVTSVDKHTRSTYGMLSWPSSVSPILSILESARCKCATCSRQLRLDPASTVVKFVRGVSGGERKRVSIAEAAPSAAPLQCWDNSTRGLDSANAVEFCKTLRMSTDLAGSTACVAIYQAPQNAYNVSHYLASSALVATAHSVPDL